MMRYLTGFLQRLLKKDYRHLNYQSVNMSNKKIAVCQMTSIADKEANLQVVRDLVGQAVKENAQMVFFPEACDYICDNKNDIVKNAEPILTGNTVTKYRQLAKENNVWLSMGGVHELDEQDASKMFNTHLIIDNKGDIVQAYRKLHLFDVEIPEKNLRLKESDFSHPGKHIVSPVDTPVGKIGLCICYDLRFPELSTALSIMGADVLTFPSAFTHSTGEAHWHTLLRARAIENQCYVVAAAQYGAHNPKRRSYGHAACVDPWGEVLADCGRAAPGLVVADLSADKLKDVRRNMPVFHHRRKDMYSLHVLSLRKNLLPTHETSKPSSLETRTADPAPAPAPAQPAGPTFVFGHVRVPKSCVFYQSKLSYAFVNLRCVIPGHVLVAPIREADRNEDLTEDEAADFFRSIRIVQKLMERVHNTQSCTITIQDGPAAGQTVRHLHCHVMPRRQGDFIESDLIYLELHKHDSFKSGHPAKPARSREEMDTEAAFLRAEMEKLLQEQSASS